MDIGLNKRSIMISCCDLKECMRTRFVPPHRKDDGRGPSTSPHASPPKGRFGPTIELWPRGSKKMP